MNFRIKTQLRVMSNSPRLDSVKVMYNVVTLYVDVTFYKNVSIKLILCKTSSMLYYIFNLLRILLFEFVDVLLKTAFKERCASNIKLSKLMVLVHGPTTFLIL